MPGERTSATPLLYFARAQAQAATCASQAVLSFILRMLAIIVCGGGGGLLAWLIVAALGWTGVGAAIAGAMIGMVLATLLWAGGVALIGVVNRNRT
jgi:hypothetical protein